MEIQIESDCVLQNEGKPVPEYKRLNGWAKHLYQHQEGKLKGKWTWLKLG